MIILGIETSCDETAVAVIRAEGGFEKPHFTIVTNLIASQIKIHAPFGGVVPNLAKREHAKNLPILLKKVESTIKLYKIDVIAVTVGPGLEPCIWEGVNFARDLAEKHKKPIVAANHMEGHIASVLLKQDRGISNPQFLISKPFEFPVIALLVSGGHTELVFMKKWLDYKIIGATLDDAAGEAFDKVARLLGLPYPGGPPLSKLASTIRHQMSNGDIKFPRPMIHSPNFNFSFSGLKTAVLYALRKNPRLNKAAVAREFENAVVETLVTKTVKAIKKHRPKTVILAGGVAANQKLQKELKKAIQKNDSKISIFYPNLSFTGDNAAMIAAASFFHALKKDFTKPQNLKANGRLSLDGKKR